MLWFPVHWACTKRTLSQKILLRETRAPEWGGPQGKKEKVAHPKKNSKRREKKEEKNIICSPKHKKKMSEIKESVGGLKENVQ